MPTYGYECTSCAHSFDVFQNMSDEPLKSCPKCNKKIRRLINGGSGIIFKGSGFYVTDKKTSGEKSAVVGKQKKDAGTKPEASAAPAACAGCPASEKSGSCPNSAAN